MSLSDNDPNFRSEGKLRIFRASQAVSLEESKAMGGEYSPEVIAGASKLLEAGLEEGIAVRVLFQSPETNGFSLIYAWFKKNFPLSAHSHDSDCLYYVIAGELILGKGLSREVIGSGDGFFLPAGTVYSYTAGPEGLEILEFRGVSTFDIRMRDGTPAMWDRMAAIVAANLPEWKTASPPERRVRAAGEDDSGSADNH